MRQLRVDVVASESAFEALAPEWGALVERVNDRSVFLTHEWLLSAYAWLRDTHELHVLTVRDDGRLVGALPLVRPMVGGAFRAKSLEFLAVPDTQLCDFIFEGEQRTDGLQAIVRALDATEWDVLELRHVPQHSPTLAPLGVVLAESGLVSSEDASTRNAYLDLRGTWQTYYGSRSRRMKKRNNHSANRLKKLGETTITWMTSDSIAAGEVDALVDVLAEISGRSWKESTDTGLDKEAPQRFIRTLSGHAHRRGWLSAWILRIGGAPVAMEYQLAADGRIYALRSDFDLAFEDASPGTYLNWKILEQLFGTGPTQYLMGPGDNAYKWQLTDAAETLVRLRVYNRTFRGQVLRSWEQSVRPRLHRLRASLERIRRPQPDSAPAASATAETEKDG